jgi:hypothetical protein
MYWTVGLAGGGKKVVSLDLNSEWAPLDIALPSSRPAGTWRLTVLHSIWLGIVFSIASHKLDKPEVLLQKR